MLNVGDIVLIKGKENVSRTQWRIGKINKLVIGKDAQVRGAELVVISQTGEKTVCQRFNMFQYVKRIVIRMVQD